MGFQKIELDMQEYHQYPFHISAIIFHTGSTMSFCQDFLGAPMKFDFQWICDKITKWFTTHFS
jgi:hypothetical protein